MDEDNNLDRLHSEPPEFPDQSRERAGSMSLGAAPNANGDDVSPINGDVTNTMGPPPAQIDPNAKAVHDVMNSEVRPTNGTVLSYKVLTSDSDWSVDIAKSP